MAADRSDELPRKSVFNWRVSACNGRRSSRSMLGDLVVVLECGKRRCPSLPPAATVHRIECPCADCGHFVSPSDGSPDATCRGGAFRSASPSPNCSRSFIGSLRKCRCAAQRPQGAGELISGRADAIARADNGDLVVFDWKTDVAPSERNRSAYRKQLRQYLRVLGAQCGAVVT
jgi:PD-(D/E)XK nuclease superfamily